MALDRFVYWQATRPTMTEIRRVLEDYTRGLATAMAWSGGRFTVTLPGTVSRALRRAPEVDASFRAMAEDDLREGRERWFGVYVGEDSIDVITMQTDEITNAIAEGFARLMAQRYDARRDG